MSIWLFVAFVYLFLLAISLTPPPPTDVFTRARSNKFAEKKGGPDAELVTNGFLCLKHATCLFKTRPPAQEAAGPPAAVLESTPFSLAVDSFLVGDYDQAPLRVQQLWIICMLYLAPRASPRMKIKSECGQSNELRSCNTKMVLAAFTVSDEAMVHLILKCKTPAIVSLLDLEKRDADDNFEHWSANEGYPENYKTRDAGVMKPKAGRKKACESELGAKQDEFEALETKIVKARKTEENITWYEAIADTINVQWKAQMTPQEEGAVAVPPRPTSSSKKRRRKLTSRNGTRDPTFGSSLDGDLQEFIAMPPLTGKKRPRSVATVTPTSTEV